MIQLPNNCRAGDFSVTPKNWDKPGASLNVKWIFSYWFYDDNLNQRKKITFERFNRLSTLKQKQDAMLSAMDDEKEEILNKGYNHITKKYTVDTSEISPRTPFLKALEYSLKNHHGDTDTKIDIASSLKYFSIAAKTLNYDGLLIGELEKKHIKFILEECGNIKTYTTAASKKFPNGQVKQKVWNDRLFNHTRANISLLIGPLEEIDAVNINPVKGVKRRIKLNKIRVTPTEKERELIRGMRYTNYPFFRFIKIFHHSGGRIKEILAVKKKDVTIDFSHKDPKKHEQKYKITVKKGGKHQEMERDIKDMALTFWQEILEMAVSDDQYLFSEGLVPGDKQIRREQVTRRWNLHAKKKLGIKADFYSLKHLNVTEMMDIFDDEKEVAKLTGHVVDREDNMISGTYDINSRKRKNDRLKRATNDI